MISTGLFAVRRACGTSARAIPRVPCVTGFGPSCMGVRVSLIRPFSSTPISRAQGSQGSQEKMIDLSQHPMVKKLPKSVQRFAVNFSHTPMSYLTSFLILHEITAVAPLFAIWGAFHYFDFIPTGMPDWLLENGTEFIKHLQERNEWDFGNPETGTKIILEGAAAYAIVKVLLPVRAALALYLTPIFARLVVIPFSRIYRVFITKKNQPKPREDRIWEQELDSQVKRKNVSSAPPPNKSQTNDPEKPPTL